jgi:glycosyltransferase involved in cell wall biosynthesis
VTAAPDVTVVVAVYNTMPYLTACLESVFGQTIGIDRLELIAVDDGSTDGSGAELDAWAARHPGTVTVLHQPNSGSPAAPSNRALDRARGRYVFFLGADDHLGSEALERLVGTADELDADIVLGRMAGGGGRTVDQQVYRAGNRDSVTLTDSALPWALSNTKLFRRSLIEEHGLRYPEDLRSGSDQPFTLRAVVAARRIAVRADYTFYYAVRRDDSSNITYRTSIEDFLRDAAVLMDTAADVITDPVARDRVLLRHFAWEVAKVLGSRFLAGRPDEQQRVLDGVRKLADSYLTESMRAELEPQWRIPISVAQHGTVADVVAVARHHRTHGLSPVVFEGDDFYVALPGFRDPERGFPDAWYDGSTAGRKHGHQRAPAQIRWGRSADGGPALLLTWPAVAALDDAAVMVGSTPGRITRTVTADGHCEMTAEFSLDGLVGPLRISRRLPIWLSWTVDGRPHTDHVLGICRTHRLHRRGLLCYLARIDSDDNLRLNVAIHPITRRQILGRLRRALRSRRSR